jgi:hypothetical protein
MLLLTKLTGTGGRSLKKREEQLELVNLLGQIERDTAWPIGQALKSLQGAWADK